MGGTVAMGFFLGSGTAIRDEPTEMRVAWALSAASVLLTLAAIAYSGLEFVNAAKFFTQFGGTVAALVLSNFYQRARMPENTRMIFLVDIVALYVTMAVAMIIYQYALATFRATPISDAIERWDHAVGFDWLSYASFVGRIRPLSQAMAFCYSNWMGEFVVALAIMAYAKKFDEMYEFTFAYFITGMAALSLTAFVDSKSYEAVASYAISGMHHPFGVSPVYLDKIDALRAGVDRTLDFDHASGLVSFPSIHASSALLLAVATRKLPWFWLPFLAFNILIIMGTVSEGGHNLMDVLGGLVFGIVGLASAGALRCKLSGSNSISAAQSMTAASVALVRRQT